MHRPATLRSNWRGVPGDGHRVAASFDQRRHDELGRAAKQRCAERIGGTVAARPHLRRPRFENQHVRDAATDRHERGGHGDD